MTIPAETARVAKAAHRKPSLCMQIRDTLGPVFTDEDFAPLFSHRGQPATSPARLALVLILQYAEGLTDRQAAEQVRARLDWKYALALELTDPGFDFSVLSEFRDRLITGAAEQRLLTALLTQLREHNLLTPGGDARTDSTHILSAARTLNRLENLIETLRHALEALTTAEPDWLRSWVPDEWFDRYGPRPDAYRLPKTETKRRALATQTGADGQQLWDMITTTPEKAYLAQLPALQTLRQVWVQQFYRDRHGKIRPRDPKDQGTPPATLRLDTPHDPQARTSVKGDLLWRGYRAHLSETCDPDTPHVITHVATTPAPVPDLGMTTTIHQDLTEAALLPRTHLLDTGYVDGQTLLTSRRRGVDLVGPLRPDTSWQAQAGKGFDITGFALDFDQNTATCPQGKASSSWISHARPTGYTEIHIRFPARDCRACLVRTDCTRSKTRGRQVMARPRAEHELVTAARAEQATPQWRRRYHARAGVEGTISQAVRAFGLRRTRYIGLAKTHLQLVLTAIAINLVRIDAWLREVPHGKTRITRFQALRTAA
ncbi:MULTISPECIES: IS1182 family transposase [unclassified Crossiella]|uniref:IS1182 family transposase n=1 Tax=unclassified Crossiella TaxID=2620835 RepID=UPI00200047C4|nr:MULTISPECIES: IS1182 family transposase [unclassified Crossiella]MCK2245506.1 IS1182 family transposase [Crossiella sp. S99.2]MCK2259163.1 IS1182 family transposase [Crossiella sp. S99.1]